MLRVNALVASGTFIFVFYQTWVFARTFMICTRSYPNLHMRSFLINLAMIIANGKVTNMAFMLEYSEHFYGGDLSNLDTSNVEIMEHMFASSLNVRGARDILRWDVSRVTSMERIFYNSTITFEEGTAPLDSDLFYICWSSMPNLDEGDLSEAFCESNAGGFNCACLGESIMPTVNSQCTGSQRPCFNSLGSVEGFDADSLISGSWRAAPISSSLSFLLTVISMFRGFI